MSLSRRRFVALTAPAFLSLGSVSPRFLAQAAAESDQKNRENILVVVQMSGGNDGLNTVVPFRHDEYRKHRPTLALSKNDVLAIDQDYGFHPAMSGFADLLENDQLGVVQGVGYPNPNRSHFESMDIWHTCLRKSDARPDGWLGRTIDNFPENTSGDAAALHLGHRKQPFALASRDLRVPSVKSLEEFRLDLQRRESLEEIQKSVTSKRPQSSSLLDFVQSSTDTAISVSEKLQQTVSSYKTDVTYPDSNLGRELKTVAQFIDAGLSTRIYYVEIDGFDTHSQQAEAHEALLRHVGDSVSAFVQDVNSHSHGDRVLILCFSEFGRRVAENASHGTDHGTAAPVFIAGNRVLNGLIGTHPSLSDLEQGDLKFQTDFRQVYAAILDQWLDVDANAILHGNFKPIQLLKS